jgi:hypothetical protein
MFGTANNRNTLPCSSFVELHIVVSFAHPFVTLGAGGGEFGCATSRKFASSFPDGVIGIFH